jgi:hypothetical protein
MEHTKLYLTIQLCYVVLAFISLYLLFNIWKIWKNIEIDIVKARVFLNKSFIQRNWLYIFFSSASLLFHQLLEHLIDSNYLSNEWVNLSEIIELMTFVFLIILTYEWFRILHPKNNKFI